MGPKTIANIGRESNVHVCCYSARRVSVLQWAVAAARHVRRARCRRAHRPRCCAGARVAARSPWPATPPPSACGTRTPSCCTPLSTLVRRNALPRPRVTCLHTRIICIYYRLLMLCIPRERVARHVDVARLRAASVRVLGRQCPCLG